MATGLALGIGIGRAPQILGWTPSKLQGVLWLGDPAIASSLTLVSSTHVSAWADALGSGLTLTQSTDSARPTLDASVTLNGYTSVKFNAAAAQKLVTTASVLSGNAPHSIHCVVRADAVGTNYRGFFGIGAGLNASSLVGTTGSAWWSARPGVAGGNMMPPDATLQTSAPLYNAIDGGANPTTLAAETSRFHVLSKVFDGSKARFYVDGYLCATTSYAYSIAETYTLGAGLGFQGYAAGQESSFHVLHAVAASGAHSVADVGRYAAWARRRYGSSLGYAQAAAAQIACGTESLAHGATSGTTSVTGTADYLTQLAALLGRGTRWNTGVNGSTIAQATARIDGDIAGHLSGLAPANVVILGMLGTNDMLLSGDDAPTTWARVAPYVTALRSYAPPGTRVALCTITHASTYPGAAAYNIKVDAFNALARAGWQAAGADALVDVGADARIDLLQNPGRSADGIHLDATGYGYWAEDLVSTVGGWI